MNICFLDGGRGAPQAVDTLETLVALGVKCVFSVGMCGAFAENINVGDIIIPDKAFVEEGTSLHYYSQIAVSEPDKALFDVLSTIPCCKISPIVSTDAVYRQTFFKEALWRQNGAIAVDILTVNNFVVLYILFCKLFICEYFDTGLL